MTNVSDKELRMQNSFIVVLIDEIPQVKIKTFSSSYVHSNYKKEHDINFHHNLEPLTDEFVMQKTIQCCQPSIA